VTVRDIVLPPVVGQGSLRKLLLIESVGESEPFEIVPVRQCHGSAMTADESVAVKVRWAEKAGYRVLTRNVPDIFAPYNAVIHVSERGTEDRRLDYLAELTGEFVD
jgi:hypothetical protein